VAVIFPLIVIGIQSIPSQTERGSHGVKDASREDSPSEVFPSLRFSRYYIVSQYKPSFGKKKLDLQWLDSPQLFRLKKKIFSRRSRKPPNSALPIYSGTAAL
jgi:hypothetical protein